MPLSMHFTMLALAPTGHLNQWLSRFSPLCECGVSERAMAAAMFVVWRSLIKAWLQKRDSIRLCYNFWRMLCCACKKQQKSYEKNPKKEKEKGRGRQKGSQEGAKKGGGVEVGGTWVWGNFACWRRLLAFSLPFKCLND